MQNELRTLLAYKDQPAISMQAGALIAEYRGKRVTISLRNRTITGFASPYKFKTVEGCVTLLRWLFGIQEPILCSTRGLLHRDESIQTTLAVDEETSLPLRVEGSIWEAEWWLTSSNETDIMFSSEVFDAPVPVFTIGEITKLVNEVKFKVIATTPATLRIYKDGTQALHFPSLSKSMTLGALTTTTRRNVAVNITKVVLKDD